MNHGDIVYYKFSDRYCVRARVKTAGLTGFCMVTPIVFVDRRTLKDVPGYIGGMVRMKREKLFKEIPA